eukprot:gene647-1314_t
MKSSRHATKNETNEIPCLPTNAAQQKRRTRSKAKASPGRGPLHNGLMNAAWPKSPKYPAMKSNKKTSPSTTSAHVWNSRDTISSITDQIEDMEVDSQENPVLLSSGASTELNMLRCKAEHFSTEKDVDQRKSKEETLKAVNEPAEDQMTSVIPPCDMKRKILVGKKKSKALPEIRKEQNKGDHTKTKIREEKPAVPFCAKTLPLFIVLHVSRIDMGRYSGPATCPIKASYLVIYGERIMIQMEDTSTGKELSHRIICQNITSLKVNFKHHPFYMKMQVSKIQQLNKEKSSHRNSEGASTESVIFYLTYENEVPNEVRQGLKQLFKDKLADLNLWTEPDSDEECSAIDQNATGFQNNEGVSDTKVTIDNEVNHPGALKRSKRENCTAKNIKGSPVKNTGNVQRGESSEKSNQEHRIRSLEHEAANYQLLLGQKRLEIQHLEQEISDQQTEVELARGQALKEIETKDHTINDLQSQLEHLQLIIDEEKDRNKQAETRMSEMQKVIDGNMRIVDEHKQAILVRDNQLKEVRSTATSPCKATNVQNVEAKRKLVNNLQQARAALEETRRSKNSIGEELRKTVTTMEELREQLQLKVTRNRQLEADKASDAEKLADAISSKRILQVQLNEEKSRMLSFEREFFNCRRRVENEENRRLELEHECQSLRLQIEQKRATMDGVSRERDNAVTEIGILKREIQNLNEQFNDDVDPLKRRNRTTAANNDANADVIDDWVIDRNEISLRQDTVLGVGGWGNVKLGRFRGTDVAVKQIHHLILSSHNRRMFSREMNIASRCRHPCLLQFIGATCDDGSPLFVSELLETDLRSCLGSRALIPKEALLIALDVALALNYLHKAKPTPIIHRDISSSNVLLWHKRDELHAKLSDYGAANFMRVTMTQHPGAALYSAPETSSRHQTPKVDVFSFGILLCEMLIRELPVIQQRDEQIQLIRNTEHRNVVTQCIEEDPLRRPNACELVDICRAWTLR